ncbi:hypothetical protein SAMN04489742_2014 [Arthrobacter crystallopoietes]|uniref:Uncharacterized protein n=1 Tax=Crystallibacter crystallopoietes TaxID=37928 RepID=A0A1H1CQI6_9MICC|nr:hypothetical protein SAMN04489742_2014 [Arthrobacter crystallopoietes]
MGCVESQWLLAWRLLALIITGYETGSALPNYARKAIRSTMLLRSSSLLIVVSGLLIKVGQDCEEVTAGI